MSSSATASRLSGTIGWKRRCWNAGAARVIRRGRRHPDIAAWLVERSGFAKGYELGHVGISSKHALAIINRGGASAAEVLTLKDQIQQRVEEIWGIQLDPEPVMVGF